MSGEIAGAGVGAAVGLVLLGGFLQGTFALPMKRMPRWRWENTWLVYSFVAMLILPWVIAAATVPHLGAALSGTPGRISAEVALFGFGWGVGATLFGLGISRVGIALTFAIVLGITASLGSLLPLIALHPEKLFAPQGYALLAGLAIVILGIILCAIAGQRRERELSTSSEKHGGSAFFWGLVICILSGIFSAMLNFSFVFGQPLRQRTLALGSSPAMSSNLVWAIALTAGFIANAGYCVYLLQRNSTWGIFALRGIPTAYWIGAAAMGALWFFGIESYGMGATRLGTLGAVLGWPLFLVMNIVTANVWGAAMGEWTGSSRSSRGYLWTGIVILFIAIFVISRAGAY